jgi:hypothetical protein
MTNVFSRHNILLGSLIVLCSLVLSLSLAAAQQTTQEPIIRQAEEFLQLLDQQEPLKAWAATTLYFRKKIPQDRWQQIYQGKRARLGSPTSRTLAGYWYHNAFEQAVRGLYLQVDFRTNFQARADVTERLVMYRDFDGRWRVIGYFLEFGS